MCPPGCRRPLRYIPGAAIPTSQPQLADDCPIIYGVDHEAGIGTIHYVRHRREAYRGLQDRGLQDQALRRPNNSMEPTRPARVTNSIRYYPWACPAAQLDAVGQRHADACLVG